MDKRKIVAKDGGSGFSIENRSGNVTVNFNNPASVTTNSTPKVDKVLRWLTLPSLLLKIYELLF